MAVATMDLGTRPKELKSKEPRVSVPKDFVVAFIGTRDIDSVASERYEEFEVLANFHAKQDHTLRTGGADGVDTRAMHVWLENGNTNIVICLPWEGYGSKNYTAYLRVITLQVLGSSDTEALESVKKYHPNPSALSMGAVKLHARNYLIIQPSHSVIALPRRGARGNPTGGTLQGISIAKDLGKDLTIV